MTLILVERSGPVAIMRINRPLSMNALGAAGDGDAVEAACAALNGDIGVRCAIITGQGKAFSAGGDLKAMKEKSGAFSGGGPDIREGFRGNIHRIARSLYGLEMPMIAAVNGPAIGLGCDIATMADIRLASDKATFGVPFLKIGLVPGDGGAWLLPRAIGMSRAAELFFSGDAIDASTAERWGLVSRVVPHAALLAEATALAARIAVHSPHALRMTKSLLRQGVSTGFEAALEASASNQALLCLTSDHEEGLNALFEGRAPLFRGE